MPLRVSLSITAPKVWATFFFISLTVFFMYAGITQPLIVLAPVPLMIMGAIKYLGYEAINRHEFWGSVIYWGSYALNIFYLYYWACFISLDRADKI